MEDMNEKELKDTVMREYVELMRIKNAVDKEKEIDYQLKVLKARLESLGIPVENLEQ